MNFLITLLFSRGGLLTGGKKISITPKNNVSGGGGGGPRNPDPNNGFIGWLCSFCCCLKNYNSLEDNHREILNDENIRFTNPLFDSMEVHVDPFLDDPNGYMPTIRELGSSQRRRGRNHQAYSPSIFREESLKNSKKLAK
jgi:hypothetical protein